MRFNAIEAYEPFAADGAVAEADIDPESVCPFGEKAANEDELGKERFGALAQFDEYIGYHLECYAGHVTEDDFRNRGASGGFGSWLVTELFRRDMVDAVIHVRPVEKSVKGEPLFRYGISRSEASIRGGAKSRYYPIELSKVLAQVRETPGRYAFVGLPCMVKAIRLLSRQEPIFGERIRYTIGLVCGHLKTARFAKYIAWQTGIHPDEMTAIDFRKKNEVGLASDYSVSVAGSGDVPEATARNYALYGMDWGMGFFKYGACEFCDDVLAETADVTIGDAWLKTYIRDPHGTNILVVRHPDLREMIANGQREGRVHLDPLTPQLTAKSQDAGLRHRRDGLSYRLFKAGQADQWVPRKRVEQRSWQHKPKQRRIWDLRENLRQASHREFEAALAKNDFQLFITRVDPLVQCYHEARRKMDKLRYYRALRRMAKKLVLKFLTRNTQPKS